MSVARVKLPSDPEAVAKIIDMHARRERLKMMTRFTIYKVIAAYLAGARRFDRVDLRTGELTYHFVDQEGNLEFQGQDLLFAINQIAGQLAAADLRPKVEAEGQTLGAIRQRAVGQVIADSIYSEQSVSKASSEFCDILAALGGCGIASHVLDHAAPGIGLTADLEVIHPRELFPFPSLDEDPTKAFGIMRERPVPMSHLREILPKGRLARVQEKMYWERRVIGETPAQPANAYLAQGMVVNILDGTRGYSAMQEEEMDGYAIVREVWLEGPRETCSRYIMTSGEALLMDEDYEGVEKYCPIGYARFLNNQTWHGAGVWDLLFSVCRNLELLIKSLFNNTRDIDRYGFLVMPQGTFNPNQGLREIARGLKAVLWESDTLGADGFRPFPVTPYNAGDVPGKTAAFAQQYMQSINPIRDILREKGRVDSASGLALLDEQSRRALTVTTQSLERAFGTNYRAGIASAAAKLTASPRALPVTRLTLDLAGAVIDWKTNRVSFTENPLPSASRLNFTVRETSPKSEVARKQEGKELVEKQFVSPDKFLLQSVLEGWDLPTWLKDYEAAVSTGVRNILTLYNDGISPGQMVTTPSFSRPEIQLQMLNAFMSDTPMAVASVDVQDEFIRYQRQLITWAGRSLPEGLDYNPDDLAIVNQQGPAAAAGAIPMQPAMQ